MNATPAAPYRLHIRPNNSWLQLDVRALWEYRDLLVLMVGRDLTAKYKQTLLGPAWFVLQPILTTVVFTVVFSRVARIPTSGVPAPLFYLCGLLAWNYFAQNFNSTSSIFINNAAIFGKVYFPRLVPPLAAILSNLFNVALQVVTILVFYVAYKWLSKDAAAFSIHWQIVFLPLVILQVAAISLGVGLWMSALTVTYRDFTHLSTFLMQVWMYATPLIYPLSQAGPRLRQFSLLNPMTMPVESVKFIFLGIGTVDAHSLEISGAITVILLATGLMLFQRVERTFIDTV